MIIYKFRQIDFVFDGAVNVPDGPVIPPYHTRENPPEQAGFYAVMQGGWVLIEGPKPPEPPPVPPSPEQVKTEITDATQQRLDDFARTRNYNGVLSLCTYASSPNPKFQAEGQYGVEARDATWTKLLEILAEVEAGTRPMPTGYADIELELPPLVWPN